MNEQNTEAKRDRYVMFDIDDFDLNARSVAQRI